MSLRLEYLWELSLVIHRVMGVIDMPDTSVIRSLLTGGTPKNQWLDILAGADMFREAVLSLTPAQLEQFNASNLTTRGLECSLSHLSSSTVSGETMTIEQIQRKVRRMDSLLAIKRLEDGPYTYQTSGRKRKHDNDTLASWSDGSTDFAAFVKEVWKRARGYCGNRAAIRNTNASIL